MYSKYEFKILRNVRNKYEDELESNVLNDTLKKLYLF